MNKFYIDAGSINRLEITNSLISAPNSIIDFSNSNYINGTFVGNGKLLTNISASFISENVTSSYTKTASYALSVENNGTVLITGSIYPITSSWSNYTLTASFYNQRWIETSSYYPITSSWATNWNSSSVVTLIGTKQNNITTGSTLPITSSWALNWDSASIITIIGTKQNQIITGSTFPITSSWSENSKTASYYNQIWITTGSNYPITSSWSNNATSASFYNQKWLETGSFYPITSSWALNWNSASVITLIQTKQNSIATGSSFPITSSWTLNWDSSSLISLIGTKQNIIITGSAYELTSSWALNWNSASLIGLLNTKQNTILTGSTFSITSSNAISSSYALSASYAPGGNGTSLVTASSYPITASWSNNSITSSYGNQFTSNVITLTPSASIIASSPIIDEQWSLSTRLGVAGNATVPMLQSLSPSQPLALDLMPGVGSTSRQSRIDICNANVASASFGYISIGVSGTDGFIRTYGIGGDSTPDIIIGRDATNYLRLTTGVMYVDAWSRHVNHIDFNVDNTYDIGSISTNRPRYGYFASGITCGTSSIISASSFIGNLTGTASYSSMALSASYALSTSNLFSISSSWASSSISSSNTLTASYALSASWAPGGNGTSLSTGSSYPITSSWASNWNSASLITLIETKQNNITTGSTLSITSSQSISASYVLSASYAPGGNGTSLNTGSTYPITSSWSNNSISSSNALTASLLLGNVVSSSYSLTASYIPQTLVRGGSFINSSGITTGVNVAIWKAQFPCSISEVNTYISSGSGGVAVNARVNGIGQILTNNLQKTGSGNWASSSVFNTSSLSTNDTLEIMLLNTTAPVYDVSIQINLTK